MSSFGNFSIGSSTGYNRAYDGTQAWRPNLWVTVAPEMWQFFQTNNVAPQDMSLRAKQLLGLPNTSTAYYVTEFYVEPQSLFRPALDPDITDPVTSLTPQGAMKDPTSDIYKWFQGNLKTYTDNPPYALDPGGLHLRLGNRHRGAHRPVGIHRLGPESQPGYAEGNLPRESHLGPLGHQPHLVQVLRARNRLVQRDRLLRHDLAGQQLFARHARRQQGGHRLGSDHRRRRRDHGYRHGRASQQLDDQQRGHDPGAEQGPRRQPARQQRLLHQRRRRVEQQRHDHRRQGGRAGRRNGHRGHRD